LWCLFIIPLHRNLRRAVGKVPIDSGGERSIAIVTSSSLLEDGRAAGVVREETWKLQRLIIAICSGRAG
jgi:hypothetical protein